MTEFKNVSSFDDHMIEFLQKPGMIEEFLNVALEDYIDDGDFNSFYRSLEYVIRAKDDISGFAQKTNLSRTTLYDIFKNKKEPKVITLAKILKELGLSLKVA